MKITINVDCTPEEARRYMGLPDVGPMQEAMLEKVQDRMTASISSMQPAEMMKAWLPMGIEGWQTMQKAIWSQFAPGGENSDGENSDDQT